ncbi:calcium channel protein [Serendipita sp. 401]|nr:calcium channel protein [Serendipita sp. 401]KAG9057688.1 calcium channel protein [Serendipita sp. 407]
MEPSHGVHNSPLRSRREYLDGPSPLPHDAIQHESLSMMEEQSPKPRIRIHDDRQDQNRPFRHEVHSQASDLDSPIYTPGDGDDTVHLTSQNTVWRRSAPYERDLERRRGHGSREPRAGALRAMSKSIKRASVRVVNFAGADLDDRPVRLDDTEEVQQPNAGHIEESVLRGRTLGIFGPKNPIRLFMYRILTSSFTEELILLLIMLNAAILTVQSVRHVFSHTPNGGGYFQSWEDVVILCLFIIYTIEAICRSIVSGLLVDPEIPFASLRISLGGLRRQGSITTKLSSVRPRFMHPSASVRTIRTSSSGNAIGEGDSPSWGEKTPSGFSGPQIPPQSQPSSNSGSRIALRLNSQDLPFQAAISKQMDITSTSRPYLRHSWNRVDAVAIVSFWIMFVLCILGKEKTASDHLYIFRALSVLRTTRLLAITSGTTTIMTSLKRAAPQLVNVAFFVLFAVILFSIVGVQSFKGSFRRSCIVVDNGQETIDLEQPCGGHIDPETLQPAGYFALQSVATSPKGFICPLGQICREKNQNPSSNAEQFDNIFGAALQIIIIASANGWSGNMYSMMSTDFFISCIFFILCLIVLNFWLLNLFVAVITQSFGATRAETKRSAFGAEGDIVPLFEGREAEWETSERRRRTASSLQKWHRRLDPFFALLALASLTLQAWKTVETPKRLLDIFFLCEVGITITFGVEIVWRILATFPEWRNFFTRKRNFADLSLAIICGVIIIPPIPSTQVYPWLTVFQLMRFYRVILLLPGMKALLVRVFGNMRGLMNMTIFLMLANFLAALFAVQLFRNDVPETFNMNFQGVVTSFLAMYQVFTSENWTDVMWATSDAEYPFKQQVIAILFVVMWFFFANFIMLQMFIAVINENFEVAEEQKRAQQVHAFIQRAGPTTITISWIEYLNPYRRMKANPKTINVAALPENLVINMKKSIVREYRAPGEANTVNSSRGLTDTQIIQGPLGTMRRFMGMDNGFEHVPLTTLKGGRPVSSGPRDTLELDETERHLEAINAFNQDTTAEDNLNELLEKRAQEAEFISDHPTYDKPFWILSQQNPLRQWCQRLVPPSNGDNKERINGLPPSPWLEFGFRAVMLATVIAGIAIAAFAGPLYRREYFKTHDTSSTWYDIAEATFGFLLVIELIIKLIADGFIWTPNAYLLNIWNILDLIILIAILINVTTSLLIVGGLSRGTRALKAFRALRLITLIGWMRETFHSVIFAGARRILDAAVLALLYMVPYAVWGLNIFSGRMYACNDGTALGRSDCQNEYMATPVDESLAFLAPRVWDIPSPSTTFSFDSFTKSFLILFEIVSLEGWIDVLKAALGITGQNQQPRINASRVNAIFFVLYNLLGAVVILTLFVSIIISNFSSRSGMALLTADQKQWIDLKKLISRQKPSKRPQFRPKGAFKSWCFDRAVQKRGWWSRTQTVLYCVQIAILMSQTFNDSQLADRIRDYVFLGLAVCFLADPCIKFIGLGWDSFRANGWNIFDVFVVLGSIATTLAIILGVGGFTIRQAQKLFLVCVAFKLMQKLDGLNQLFKTAVSSLSVIAKLFGLWFSLFLFFGILWLEVFALTKWGSGESVDKNYQSLSRTLVMMAFMSTGENWNQYMHDYAISYPRCTNSSSSLAESDCGSRGWSFTLFIAWNVVSMYIFVNMFTGVVVENFSYIYQTKRNQTLNREEMRSFKKVWAMFDQSSTGYLHRHKIVPFLAKLSGVFEVRIYPGEYQLSTLFENSLASADTPFVPGQQVVGLDLRKLSSNLKGLDRVVAQRRRKLYNYLFWEARLISQTDSRGISFQRMLLLLCHYKLIDDQKALKVDELLRRRAIKEQVDDRVNFDKVRSLFRMIYHRKKFLAHMENKRRQERQFSNTDVPEIIVAGENSPPMHGRDITRAHFERDSWSNDAESPNATRTSFMNTSGGRFDMSPSSPNSLHSPWSDPASPTQPGNLYRQSAFSVLPQQGSTLHSSSAYSSRRNRDQVQTEDPDAILMALNASKWGEMMMDVVEEEEGEPSADARR